MINKLNKVEERFRFLESEMSKPENLSDQNIARKLNKEHSQLLPIVQKSQEYKKMREDLEGTNELLSEETDTEMLDMLKEEKQTLEKSIDQIEDELMILLLPKDPNSGKNIIMEIRAGTGGDEAALFASDLFRMYTRYADVKGYKLEMIENNQNDSQDER